MTVYKCLIGIISLAIWRFQLCNKDMPVLALSATPPLTMVTAVVQKIHWKKHWAIRVTQPETRESADRKGYATCRYTALMSCLSVNSPTGRDLNVDIDGTWCKPFPCNKYRILTFRISGWKPDKQSPPSQLLALKPLSLANRKSEPAKPVLKAGGYVWKAPN